MEGPGAYGEPWHLPSLNPRPATRLDVRLGPDLSPRPGGRDLDVVTRRSNRVASVICTETKDAQCRRIAARGLRRSCFNAARRGTHQRRTEANAPRLDFDSGSTPN